MKKLMIPLFAVMVLFLASLSAHAVQYGFENISANSVANAAIGEAQLSVDVTDFGGGQALFTFSNAGPAACSITDVYFDDGSLLGIMSLIDADEGGGNAGVDFSQLASPSNLPSANNASPPFVTTAGFSADSDSPVIANGVNPGETLGVVFNLQAGRIYADVLSDLDTGDLRVGIHVQGFAGGGSESFVNNGANGVPEPATLLLLGSGLLGLAVFRRKSRK